MLKFQLYLLLLLFALGNAKGQEVIGTREGLSNRYVTSIQQDNNGLMWIGTRNGLNCYDGYTFKRYFSYTTDLQLSSAGVNTIQKMDNGALLIGTNTGLNIVYPNVHRKPTLLLQSKNIVSISNSSNNTFFAATSEGEIFEIDSSQHSKPLFVTEGKITLLQTDHKKQLWFCIASPKAIYTLSASKRLTQQLPGEIKGYYQIFGDTLLACGINDGLALYNVSSGKRIFCSVLDSISAIYKNPGIIYRDKKDNFWINFGYGTLIKLNIQNRQAANYSYYFNRAYFTNKITCIAEDLSGMIWVGTEGGLIKIPQPPPFFKQYLVNKNSGNADDYISTRGIVSDSNGNLYVGSYKGLYIIDKKNNSINRYLLDKKQFESEQPSPHQLIWFNNKTLLLTSSTKGLLLFNIETHKFDFATSPPDKHNNQLLALLKTRDSSIWVGSYKGIYQYNNQQKLLIPLHLKDQNGSPINASIWRLVEDKLKNIWVGSNMGLYKIQPEKSIVRYHVFSNPSLSNNEILDIYIESDSSVWLASKGGGVMHFNTVTDSITVFNTDNGLSDNIVYGILPDGTDHLWLSTESGLSHFNKRLFTFQNYYEQDGISNNEFNAGSAHKSSTGEFFWGGINGITSFTPNTFNQSIWQPHIILTELSHSSKLLTFNQPLQGAPIVVNLPYNDKFLSLRFTLNDFYEPQFNTFSYKIEELDNHWTKLGAQNFLRITDLPAGTYTLLVKGMNMNGIESSNIITITINVAQVFYKQAWFIGLVILLLVIIIYSIARFRLQQLLALQKLRTKIASDLHDEVGSMLTRISILTEVLKYQKLKNPEIDQIASVSRMATTTMSDVLWSIDARNDKIGNLIDRMRDHADSLLLPLHKNIIFHTQNIDTGTSMKMQERQNTLLIFKEAINNIAKHSNASEVNITFEHAAHGLFLSISDNGSNINTSKTGQGLKNIEMRAHELNATISFDTTNGFRIEMQF